MQKLITLVVLLWVGYSSTLHAQCASGSMSGKVFQDINFDGLDNDGAYPIGGIKVYLFNQAGQVDSTTTLANGTFAFTGKTDGQKYRVEFHANNTGYKSGPFGLNSKTTVQFATAPNCAINQGFVSPGSYCQTDPFLFTPCFINGNPLGGGSSGDTVAFVGMPYSASGGTHAANVDLANASEIGSCWGVTYQKESKLAFTSAVLKRHSGFGPGGTGAIYVYDISTPAASSKIATIDLDALGFDTGTDPRILNPLPINSIDPSHDVAAFNLVGKMSLGDLDISDDGKYLYVTNLFDRKIYKIFINNPFQQPTAADVTAISLTNPGCGNNADWRPWGLEFHNGSLYAGLVCTAETSQDTTQLRAFVQKLNAGGTFDPFFDMGLTFERGQPITSAPINNWNAWTGNYLNAMHNFAFNFPQPILSDIEFEADGSLLLGFADRMGIQGGFENYPPDVNITVLMSTNSGGDLIKVCNINGALVLEGAAGCDNPMGIGTGQGPNGDEFFWDDRFENTIAKTGQNAFEVHQETSLGGLFALYGSGEVVTTQFDPLDYNTGGTGTFNTTTGILTNNYEIFPALPGYAGKSAGLGDLEGNCGLAPLEKGNFVWRDYNENGIQDPNDTGIEGVNVSLVQVVNGVCSTLVTTMTNSLGEYYFNDANVPGGLLPLKDYAIVIGESQFNSTSLRLFDSLGITTPNVGTWVDADRNDSDGELMLGAACLNNKPHSLFTTGSSGDVNHTCDFGFIVACDIVFSATSKTNETCAGNSNGSIAVTATSSDPAGVQYRLNMGAFSSTSTFSNLAPGTYTVRAQVVGQPTCFADSMFTIAPGLAVPAPTNVAGFGICQNSAVPANSGLTATCSACPQGFTGGINWYSAATGGTLVGTGSPFNPVAAGAVNASIAGKTTFYAECACGPCVSSRVMADFTVFPLPTPQIAGDTLPCPGETVTYTTAFTAGNSYVWTLSGGGTILSTAANSITIQWNNVGTGGTFTLSVKETDANGCMQTVQINVCIRTLTLVCKNVVQVSLQNDCKATLSFGNLLQGNYKTTDGFVVEVTDMNGTLISNNGMIMGAGMYNFKVIEPCQNNSCWGVIKAEDKLGPNINCQPVSFPCTYTDTAAVIPNLAGLPTFVPIGGGINNVIITDNCGVAAVQYSDAYYPFSCDTLAGVLAGKLVRTWTAQDAAGNSSTCTQEISFVRQQLSAIQWPKDTIISCENGNISPNNVGFPTILGNRAWPSAGFCNFEVVYTDQVVPVCDGTTKYIRTWKAIDWCLPLQAGTPSQQANPILHVQVITVMDSKGPNFTCPANVTVSATTSCSASYDLPDVIVTDACSRISKATATLDGKTVQASLTTFPGNNLWAPDTLAKFGIVADVMSGKHLVTYRMQDDCGNTSTCSFEMTVNDGAPPVAICDAHTQVALGATGETHVPAVTFDDGSIDNCADVYFKTRRMRTNSCQNNTQFDDFAAFCCTDIGDTVQVILRVYDQSPIAGRVGQSYLDGHYSDCMVTVTVVDKIRPYVACPVDVTVSCEAFDPSLWAHGQATSQDNCALDTLTTSANYTQFDTVCNVGTITRTFTAFDVYGNTGRCTQKVTVTRKSNYKIKFPNDLTINNCDGTFATPEPVIIGKTCEQIGIGYKDEILTLVPDACFKILRTWRVEDGCLYDPNYGPLFIPNPINDDKGVEVQTGNYMGFAFQYTQVIKVIDNQKPIISNCPTSPLVIEDKTDNDPTKWNGAAYWDNVHQTHDLCEAPNGLFVTAYDSCSGTNISARYLLFLDLNGDGTMETTYISGQTGAPSVSKSISNNQARFGLDPVYTLPHGTHKIKWVIADGCGNEAVCEYQIKVVDAKKPTIVCRNGYTATIMQTGMIALKASTFVEYGFDNCTPAAQLQYAIRKQGTGTGWPTDTVLQFTCADIATQFVEVWVRDKAGNADFCVTYVIIQDNMGVCNPSMARVAGALMTTDIEGVQEAMVKIAGNNAAVPVPNFMTAYDGRYNFTAIPIGNDYVITPAKSDDWLNGVNTYDLLLIQKHLLGIQPFTSPYKLIAADANKSNSVTPSDIITLRRMIMGMDDGFANNTSWRFVDESYVFPVPTNPFTAAFPETLVFGDLQQNVSSGDFVSMKVGDLNGSAKPNNFVVSDDRTADGQLVFDLQNKAFEAGESVSLDFKASDLSAMEGFQFTLRFDTDMLIFEDLDMGDLTDISEDNFGLQRSKEGYIIVSWNAASVAAGVKNAFTVQFRAKKAANLDQAIYLSNSLLKAEAYTKSDEFYDIAFRFDGQNSATAGLELLQNKPNPFDASTTIGFYLPKAGQAKLQVFDLTGRMLHVVEGSFAKGYNAVQIQAGDLNTTGAMFYRIESEFGTAERKMIRN